MFRFYLLFVPLFTAYGAKSCSLLYAKLGGNVTIPCFYPSSGNHLSWYKQAAGRSPQIISYSYLSKTTFVSLFKDNRRFSVDPGAEFYHLKILNVQQFDLATYYCARTTVAVTEFDNGTFLAFKESSRRSFLQQAASESVQPGDSVTVSCTVHAGTCNRSRSVYWFRYNSGDFHLEIINTNGERCGHCHTHSCVYSLQIRNVSLSDAGTYYCAVASSGEILLGGGMRLDVGGKQSESLDTSVLIYCLSAALLVSLIVIIILACALYKMTRRQRPHSQVRQPQSSNSEHTAGHQLEDSDALQYVALDFKKKANARRQKSTEETETIYSGVRQTGSKRN